MDSLLINALYTVSSEELRSVWDEETQWLEGIEDLAGTASPSPNQLEDFLNLAFRSVRNCAPLWEGLVSFPLPESFANMCCISLVRMVVEAFVIETVVKAMVQDEGLAKRCLATWASVTEDPVSDGGVPPLVEGPFGLSPVLEMYSRKRSSPKRFVWQLYFGILRAVLAEAGTTNSATGRFLASLGPDMSYGAGSGFMMNTTHDFNILYVMWNMALCCRLGEPYFLSALLVPSVTQCLKSTPEKLVHARLLTMAV